MAEQSFLTKLGLRLGTLGTFTNLAIAAPLSNGDYSIACHTDAARVGEYYVRTSGSERIGYAVGGQVGPQFNRVNSVVGIQTSGMTTVTRWISNGAAGTDRITQTLSAALGRWRYRCSGTAESGSDAGSNWLTTAFTDAGITIDSPLQCNRASLGTISWVRPVFISAGTLTGSQTLLDASCTWNNVATTFTGWRVNVTTTTSAAGSMLMDLQLGSVSRFSVMNESGTTGSVGGVVSSVVDDGTSPSTQMTHTAVLTGSVTDAYSNVNTTAVNGAFTVTRYNWFNLANPTGSSTITSAYVWRFNAAAGTHKCVDAGTTKTTPTGVGAWMKINISGTVYFVPTYASKTA